MIEIQLKFLPPSTSRCRNKFRQINEAFFARIYQLLLAPWLYHSYNFSLRINHAEISARIGDVCLTSS